MTLHLFDPPTAADTGPSLDALLEGFWGGKDPAALRPSSHTVWVMERVYREERGDDALYYEVFATQADALWSYWFEGLDDAYQDGYFDSVDPLGQPYLTPSQWLSETLTAIQDLRDDGIIDEGDTLYRLNPMKVNG